MTPIQIFDLIRFIPVTIILTIAAYQDYTVTKTTKEKDGTTYTIGYAKNWLWLYMPIGLALTITEFLFVPEYALLAAESAAITAAAAIILYLVGGWGAADTKALLLIAASTPLTPLVSQLVSLQPIFTLVFAGVLGMLVMAATGKQKIRFLPLILTGYLLAALI